MNNETSTLLLTPQQAADELQISVKKLWTLTKSGEIPSIRIGERSIRYLPETLRAYVLDRQQLSTVAS